jgi:hypothetical protein
MQNTSMALGSWLPQGKLHFAGRKSGGLAENIQILFSVYFAEPGEMIQAVMKKISIV